MSSCVIGTISRIDIMLGDKKQFATTSEDRLSKLLQASLDLWNFEPT